MMTELPCPTSPPVVGRDGDYTLPRLLAAALAHARTAALLSDLTYQIAALAASDAERIAALPPERRGVLHAPSRINADLDAEAEERPAEERPALRLRRTA